MEQSFARVLGAVALMVLVGVPDGPAVSQGCAPRDFLQEPLPAASWQTPWQVAISVAYPEADLQTAPSPRMSYRGAVISVDGPTSRPARQIIETPTIGDQFAILYPLSRNLDLRLAPFYDPGRARSERFFGLLYGETAGAVEQDLETVAAGPARFRVTRRHGVACQLAVAVADLDLGAAEIAPLFRDVGGSYNWRRIAGTDRLSAHSYGIAVDVNAAIGGYWRWSGATEGAVGTYENKVPWALVEAMERRGFIWGGKWHHFDGMHFEYRPELILYSRLMEGAGQ
ncbi:D-alanyl-D-alanine carboxypeptidase [Roseovarius nanhaiticus]|uniref:D-alanyl-D-alanine carboxypeptidase n=1 Tax=Roseovarius nanhaiticus TaxID=573024 RepID=A0A1N7GWM7_9RHOB|nr:D-alanyl-D-alanine carboxypeptidase [Roseovarius nanhaiticus]SIS16997.1 D-alanyl-D-alanine carboxypeptidase [Roseovarius nanhaiticus]